MAWNFQPPEEVLLQFFGAQIPSRKIRLLDQDIRTNWIFTKDIKFFNTSFGKDVKLSVPLFQADQEFVGPFGGNFFQIQPSVNQ